MGKKGLTNFRKKKQPTFPSRRVRLSVSVSKLVDNCVVVAVKVSQSLEPHCQAHFSRRVYLGNPRLPSAWWYREKLFWIKNLASRQTQAVAKSYISMAPERGGQTEDEIVIRRTWCWRKNTSNKPPLKHFTSLWYTSGHAIGMNE